MSICSSGNIICAAVNFGPTDKSLDNIISTILKLSEKNIYTIMPGFTHLKNAQAVSFSHYLMAYVEMFSRDKKKIYK